MKNNFLLSGHPNSTEIGVDLTSDIAQMPPFGYKCHVIKVLSGGGASNSFDIDCACLEF